MGYRTLPDPPRLRKQSENNTISEKAAQPKKHVKYRVYGKFQKNHQEARPRISHICGRCTKLNLAPTEGYKKLVGTKTTLRFVNTIHAGYHENDEVDVMQMQSQVGVQLYIKFRKEAPKQPLVAFDPQFSEFVSSNVATLPTGGYFAIWFALCIA